MARLRTLRSQSRSVPATPVQPVALVRRAAGGGLQRRHPPTLLASGRSVLLVMVLHATNNPFSGSFVSPFFTGADASHQAAITALLWAVTAAVLLANTARSAERGEESSGRVGDLG